MLKKVISGGQRGADVGALLAAKRFGLATGGWMPKGFKTLDGLHPEYAERFGMTETKSDRYPECTKRNVRDSHGTIRFASNFESRGERCTLRWIKYYHRHSLDIKLPCGPDYYPVAVRSIHKWIETLQIETLNVAGNANKRVEMETYEILYHLFEYMGLRSKV